MKQFLLIFVGLTFAAIGFCAHASNSDDAEQTWERAHDKHVRTQESLEDMKIKNSLIPVRGQHIQEALSLAEKQTGEPASSFKVNCIGSCDLNHWAAHYGGVMAYYRYLILRSRDQVCKYDAMGAPENYGWTHLSGSVKCLPK